MLFRSYDALVLFRTSAHDVKERIRCVASQHPPYLAHAVLINMADLGKSPEKLTLRSLHHDSAQVVCPVHMERHRGSMTHVIKNKTEKY